MFNIMRTTDLLWDPTGISLRNISGITLILNASKVNHVFVVLTPVPLYQNLLNLFFTLLFMVLYTITVNTPNERRDIDFVEGCLFAFALGFFFDEVTRLYIILLTLTIVTKAVS